MLQLSPFFPLTVIPRCFNIYSFISRFTGSFVEFLRPRAGTDDGYAASFDHLVLSHRPVDPSPCISSF